MKREAGDSGDAGGRGDRGTRLFRALLRLLPWEFRDRYGRDMTHTFRDQRRDAADEGFMGILRLWLETIHGLLTTAPGEHLAILRQDVGYALRVMRKHPGFTLVSLVTLIIAISANSAIFTIVRTVLLKPFPYAEPDRLVLVWERNLQRGENRANVSIPTFLDWRDAISTAPAGEAPFTHVAAVAENSLTLADATGRGAMRVSAFSVTAEFFDVLGVQPQLGRLFTAQDEHVASNAAPPVVVSHGFWQRQFGGRADAMGQTITFDDRTYTVVGVLPASFRFLDQGDVWTPFTFSPDQTAPNMRGARYLRVIARVKPGVTLRQADERFAAIVQGLAVQGRGLANWTATTTSLQEYAVGQYRASIWLLMGAVGFVLLIACANLASLLLARTVSRREEMAVRAAIGAGHARLFRQLLTESCVLGMIAGTIGVAVAAATLKPLASLAPTSLPRVEDLALDWQVLAFTLGISLLTGLLFGLAPAVRMSAANLFDVLRAAGRDMTTGRRSRLVRDPLLAAQVGLTLVLLVGATLMARSFIALRHVSLGFAPANVLTHFVSMPQNRYPTNDHLRTFADELLRQASSVPGAQAAGLDLNLPLTGSQVTFGFAIPKYTPAAGERMAAQAHTIAGDYFRAIGLPILRGRAFDARDTASSPPVIVINETMARRYWPNANPVGETVRLLATGIANREIVGVVSDVKHGGLTSAPEPEIYVPHAQEPWRFAHLVIRTDAAHAATLPAAIRAQMVNVDKRMPFDRFVWMDDLVAEALAPVRFQMLLLGFFAGVALLLSLVCIYGVMSYVVGLRLNELGVRMALGASPRDLVWLVVGEAMKPALAGIAAGLAVAIALARVLRAQFFAIDSTDPATLAAVVIALVAVALAACYLPARRATKVDPIITLRS